MHRAALLTVSLAAALLVTEAHMGLTPTEGAAGERIIVSLRIGHDCGDETIGTTNFTVVLPRRLFSVSVEKLADWRIFMHHEETSKGVPYVRAVTFLGFLPDGFYQLFNLRIQMPDKVGKVLWFKGYQDCHNQGTSIAWDQIPNEKNPLPRYPARSVTVVKNTELRR